MARRGDIVFPWKVAMGSMGDNCRIYSAVFSSYLVAKRDRQFNFFAKKRLVHRRLFCDRGPSYLGVVPTVPQLAQADSCRSNCGSPNPLGIRITHIAYLCFSLTNIAGTAHLVWHRRNFQ